MAIVVWIGFQIRNQHQELFSNHWGAQAQSERFPTTPSRPSFEPNEGRSALSRFHHPHGYYDAPFNLILSSENPETEIWYTTDGSVPVPGDEFNGPNGEIYEQPIAISNNACVTAVSVEPEKEVSMPRTQTYLFLSDILGQSPSSAEEDGWPKRPANGKRMDYGMDPRIVGQFSIKEWKTAFEQIPTISLVTEQANLTSVEYGIYSNPTGQGKGWERYTSVELLANQNEPGFQTGAGLRIRGGFTRNPYFPKHSFRLFFRKKYGAGKLKYPLFDSEGADRFDKVDLRTAQNYSWAREGGHRIGSHNTFVREVFCRDTQRDMGSPYTRSRYYHLFLNTQYWGIYMTEERPEANYGATYFPGKRDDFDTLKCSNFLNNYLLEATDGDTKAWRDLWDRARDLAENPTDETYAELAGNSHHSPLVEIDNLINYMLIIFYSGNTDGPLSAFLGNKRSNNWFALRNRNGDEGFRFFIHDAEHTLGAPESADDRTGPYHSRNQDRFQYSNPQWIHQDLMSHASYRKRFSQLARIHLTEGGALTTEKAVKRFQNRANMIDKAIRAQSARWGDAARPRSPYLVEDWESRIQWVIDEVLTGREKVLISQLRGCETDIFVLGCQGEAIVGGRLALRRSFQKSSKRRLVLIQRRARTFSAPDSDQNMPDCLQRAPITVLHPASTTPEPMK